VHFSAVRDEGGGSVTICMTTITGTPRLRSEWASILLGAGDRTGNLAFQTSRLAQPPHVGAKPMPGAISADNQVNPFVTRDRVVGAAVKGSPPRGAPH
jgi:hypothetical protein